MTLTEFISDFLNLNKDGEIVSVDWKALADRKKELGWGGRKHFDSINDDLVDYLLEEGFLVRAGQSDEFHISGIGCLGLDAGPSCFGTGGYGFRTREDAEDYVDNARGLVEGALFPLEILHRVKSKF